jgi:hypothetical protein
MKTCDRFFTLAFWIILTASVVNGTCSGKNTVPPAMVGPWRGQARIIVAWCQQTNLAVEIQIAPNGEVTGKVGDAALQDGQFKRNRGSLGRKLKMKTDYIVTGKLKGSIVAAENITRRSVNIPLNFSNGAFTGGIHTSGTLFGADKSMIFSAAALTLNRTDSPIKPENSKGTISYEEDPHS